MVTPLGEHSLARKYLRSVGIVLDGMSFRASLIVMDTQEYDDSLGMD